LYSAFGLHLRQNTRTGLGTTAKQGRLPLLHQSGGRLPYEEGEPVDEVPFSFEMGITLTRHYVLLGRLYGVRSISEDDNQNNFTIVDGKVQNFVGTGALEDYVKAQAQLIYKIHPNIDLSFEVDQVLTGRNTSHATTVGFGMAFHK